MIWKNVFYNLTVIWWKRIIWYFRDRKSLWSKFLRPGFQPWTKKQEKKSIEDFSRAILEYFRG